MGLFCSLKLVWSCWHMYQTVEFCRSTVFLVCILYMIWQWDDHDLFLLEWWCAFFVVSWIIWTFPQSCFFITDVFLMWYLQSWLAGVTHPSDTAKNMYIILNQSAIVIICISSIFFSRIASLQSDLICFVFSFRGPFALEPLLILCKWCSSRMCSNYRVISFWPSEDYSCISGWTKGKSDIISGPQNCIIIFFEYYWCV
jgi:hypothetical protein